MKILLTIHHGLEEIGRAIGQITRLVLVIVLFVGPVIALISTNLGQLWLFLRWRVGFIRRRPDFGALGFAQRNLLVLLSLFLLAPSTCRPRSLGSISSVIWLECHGVLVG